MWAGVGRVWEGAGVTPAKQWGWLGPGRQAGELSVGWCGEVWGGVERCVEVQVCL